jgi:hypothetical protein
VVRRSTVVPIAVVLAVAMLAVPAVASFPGGFQVDGKLRRYSWWCIAIGRTEAQDLFEYVGPFLPQRADVSKARDDIRSIASAVFIYLAHMGTLPTSLGALTLPSTNNVGQSVGPVLTAVPDPPRGWTPYAYRWTADGAMTVESCAGTP